MNLASRFSRNDLARYLEGEMDDAAEAAALEQLLDTDPAMYAAFLVLADELAEATEKPPEESSTTVDGPNSKLLADVVRLIEEVRVGRHPQVTSALEEASWRQLGGYIETPSFQAATGEAATAGELRRCEYSHGRIRIQDSADAIPFGVVRILLIDRESEQVVAAFLAAVPRYDGSRERLGHVTVANHLADQFDPRETTPRVIAARDDDSLALFQADEVRRLLEPGGEPLDDELRESIGRLLDLLDHRDST